MGFHGILRVLSMVASKLSGFFNNALKTVGILNTVVITATFSALIRFGCSCCFLGVDEVELWFSGLFIFLVVVLNC
jgi:hypothetical protein